MTVRAGLPARGSIRVEVATTLQRFARSSQNAPGFGPGSGIEPGAATARSGRSWSRWSRTSRSAERILTARPMKCKTMPWWTPEKP